MSLRGRLLVVVVVLNLAVVGAVQIGSAWGSTIGQWLKMPESRIKSFVACGAAGGIADINKEAIRDHPFGRKIWGESDD